MIESARGLPLLKVPSGPINRSLGDVHPSGNPHYTLDPGTLPAVTATIASGLARLRPDLAPALESNRREFLSRVEVRFRRWRETLAPHHGARVVSYHDRLAVPLPRLRPRGARGHRGSAGRATDPAAPGPQLVRQMRAQRARVVVLESWYAPDTAAAVARQAGARLVVVPQSPGAVRGTDDYIAHMDYLVTALARALSEAE